MKALCLVLTLIFCVPAFSQEKEHQVRACRVFIPEPLDDKIKEIYLFDGQTSYDVQPAQNNLSPVYELANSSKVLSLSLEKGATALKPPLDTPNINIPEGISDILILLLPDPSNPTVPIKFQLIDIGDEHLKIGETMWINLTKNTISAELGTQQVLVEPDSQVASKAPATNSGYYLASFSYKAPEAETFAAIMRKSWWHDATNKNLGFIVKNHRGILPIIFLVRDCR
jgi:uncharacterized membrane protein